MRQVIENIERSKRHYALRGRVTTPGWRDDQIINIDSDQGESVGLVVLEWSISIVWVVRFQRAGGILERRRL